MTLDIERDPDPAPLWAPSAEQVAAARMTQLRSAMGLAPQADLHAASLADQGRFWSTVWRDCSVLGEAGPIAFEPPPADDIRDARYFPQARISLAENLLAGGGLPGAGPVAVVFRREDGRRSEVTWTRLRSAVAQAAQLLRDLGVGPGDRVAAWVPNTPEALVAMLATNTLGAVFTSTSPDFGAAGVLDRFGQVAPKVLVAADGYVYGGKRHDRLAALAEVVAGLPGLAAVLVFPHLLEPPAAEDALALLELAPRAVLWQPLAPFGPSGADPAAAPAVWAGEVAGALPAPLRGAFDDPGFILYSSGTTGPPKCIVHRSAGLLLKHLSEHQYHCDIRPGDRVFYYTTLGWMMWNWLVGALASGATVVLYDGSPSYPPSVLWDLAEQERVTLFGTSAKFLDACAKAGLEPAASHDLASLRTVTSTGSPLSVEGFEYVYRKVKADLHLASISGGTDLCGCFVLGDPTRPVYPGEIQGAALGTAADVWDESGRSLANRPGVRGELVCTAPFPSMPLSFWGDDGSRYQAAYFSRFPGVWAHGDFASRTAQGGFVIHGRSDATLNAGGVRIGTAEIYRQVEQLPEVLEALAIGQEWDNDTRIVLFVRLAEGVELDRRLQTDIRDRLRRECSPRHVPARLVAVADLPRTRSGKLAELAVADVVHGREVRNCGALANPQALELFRARPELAQ